MIKIGEYESLNFIRWIKTKDINHENDILRLADDYINKNKKNWGIKFFLKLYQDYLVNIMQSRYVNNYMETFEEFCSDINNLKYIQIFTVDKAPYLQSIFQNLYIYIKGKNIFYEIDSRLKSLAKQVSSEEQDILIWFNEAIDIFKRELLNYFDIYINNSINEIYKYEFKVWAEQERNKVKFIENDINNLYKSNRKLILISLAQKRDIEYLKRKYSKDVYHGNCYAFLEIENIYGNRENIINFIRYLDKKKIRIEKNIPDEKIDELVDEYFKNKDKENIHKINSIKGNYITSMAKIKKENPKESSRKLKKSIKTLVKDKKTLMYFINKLTQNREIFNIDRYYNCKYHGLLLFEPHGKISEFYAKYLESLHDVTGDTLDIYFTDKDLKKNVSGYKRIHELSYLNVVKKNIPCFIVWETDSNYTEIISLYGLNHDDIYTFIREIVISLEHDTLSESIKKANKTINEKKGNNIIINDTTIVNNTTNNKNVISKYNFENNNIGAVGDGATNIAK